MGETGRVFCRLKDLFSSGGSVDFCGRLNLLFARQQLDEVVVGTEDVSLLGEIVSLLLHVLLVFEIEVRRPGNELLEDALEIFVAESVPFLRVVTRFEYLVYAWPYLVIGVSSTRVSDAHSLLGLAARILGFDIEIRVFGEAYSGGRVREHILDNVAEDS